MGGERGPLPRAIATPLISSLCLWTTTAQSLPLIVTTSTLLPHYFHTTATLLLKQGSEFLILASDGLWDKLRNQEVVSRVRRWLAEDGLSVTEAAERLVDMAITKFGADDNTR